MFACSSVVFSHHHGKERERERESVFTIAKRENKKNDRRTTITLLQPLKAPGIHAEFFV